MSRGYLVVFDSEAIASLDASNDVLNTSVDCGS